MAEGVYLVLNGIIAELEGEMYTICLFASLCYIQIREWDIAGYVYIDNVTRPFFCKRISLIYKVQWRSECEDKINCSCNSLTYIIAVKSILIFFSHLSKR